MTSEQRNVLVAISEGIDATRRSFTRARNHIRRALGEEDAEVIDWLDDDTAVCSVQFLRAVRDMRAVDETDDDPTPATSAK
jgi:hypothetical protein